MKRAQLLLALVACASCGGLPFPAYEPYGDAARRQVLIGAATRAPATAARVSLRVTMQRRGMQHALTFDGLVFPSASLYLQSVNDWGGRGFALVREASEVRALGAPTGTPNAWWESLAAALAVALVPPSAADASLARLGTGDVVLAARRGDAQVLFAPRGDGDGMVYDVGAYGRWLSRVRTAGRILDAEGRCICPRHIEIDGIDAGYRAHAEVILWEPSDADEREIRGEIEQAFGSR